MQDKDGLPLSKFKSISNKKFFLDFFQTLTGSSWTYQLPVKCKLKSTNYPMTSRGFLATVTSGFMKIHNILTIKEDTVTNM